MRLMALEPLSTGDYGRMSDAEWRARRIALIAEMCLAEESPIGRAYSLAHACYGEEGTNEKAETTAIEVLSFMLTNGLISEAEYYFIRDNYRQYLYF